MCLHVTKLYISMARYIPSWAGLEKPDTISARSVNIDKGRFGSFAISARYESTSLATINFEASDNIPPVERLTS
ncbi:hypothetical protein Hanom_Chr12g01121901 [Helianthus anomalus]